MPRPIHHCCCHYSTRAARSATTCLWFSFELHLLPFTVLYTVHRHVRPSQWEISLSPSFSGKTNRLHTKHSANVGHAAVTFSSPRVQTESDRPKLASAAHAMRGKQECASHHIADVKGVFVHRRSAHTHSSLENKVNYLYLGTLPHEMTS